MKQTKKRQKVTTVYIPFDLADRTERFAKREGLSVSAVHRLAVLAYIGKAQPAKRKKPVKKISKNDLPTEEA